MLKKKINYTDFNGNEVSEEFYFNLTKAELAEMEMSEKGGLSETIKKIVEEEDTKAIMNIFKNLILDAYGVKSEDGKRFIKNDKLREEFSQTAAYSELFVLLASDSEAAANFVNGIVPVEAQKKMKQEQAKLKIKN
jgi:hypothetical protein